MKHKEKPARILGVELRWHKMLADIQHGPVPVKTRIIGNGYTGYFPGVFLPSCHCKCWQAKADAGFEWLKKARQVQLHLK